MKKKNRGFTLVELMVVISIIAILAIIGITVFSNIQKGARDARRNADIQSIAKTLEVYKSNQGAYPLTAGWCDYTNHTQLKTLLDSSFSGGTLPQDPSKPGNTIGNYIYNRTATGYELYASLETQPQGTVTGFCGWVSTNVYNVKISNQQ